MCCFSRPVRHVSSTSIFARELARARQLLVYSMNLDADEELAMILPLPVPPGVDERAVEFIDLEGYARFFRDLAAAFPPPAVALSRGRGMLAAAPESRPRLTVHRVGRFEASFAPTRADLDRLDPRFQLAPDAWDSLPQYRDYGFAVFKLRPRAGLLGRLLGRRRQTVHPMAFSFPRRDPATLFFPTVHVHDGTAPARADFDHTLYCQPGPAIARTFGWERSLGPLQDYVDPGRARAVIDPASRCYRRSLYGSRPNRDMTLTPPEDVELERLRARGECFALTVRATAAYYDEPAHEQQRRWHATATRHLNALARDLQREFQALEQTNRERWRLAPYDDALRELWVNGERLWIPGLWAPIPSEDAGPARVRFSPQSDHIEPQQLWLAFSQPPDAALLRDIQTELQRLLADVEARLPA